MDIKCLLGESPVYDEERRELRWLDINRRQLHFILLDIGPSSLRTVNTNALLGATANMEGQQNLIAVGKSGFATVDRDTGEVDFFAKVFEEDNPGTAYK